MTVSVLVCNLALSRLGTQLTIASPTDVNTRQGFYCIQFWQQAVQKTLTSQDWRFAQISAALTVYGTPPLNWAYQYALPADCIKPRAILNPAYAVGGGALFVPGVNAAVQNGLDYDTQVAQGTGGAGTYQRVLVTNQSPATLLYTADIEDPTLWEPAFTSAMSWQLAAELATPLGPSLGLNPGQAVNLAGAMLKGFDMAIDIARVSDANQGTTRTDQTASWYQGRGFQPADTPMLNQPQQQAQSGN